MKTAQKKESEKSPTLEFLDLLARVVADIDTRQSTENLVKDGSELQDGNEGQTHQDGGRAAR